MSGAAIAVTSLTKVFPIPFSRRVVVAVRDLNLQVAPGQIYGLLGPNGSGKSTTLKIVLGLVAATRGGTAIFGRDSSEVASREDVGFLPESPYFPKYLTAEEMLRFYGKLGGLSGSALRERIAELLELVGLTSARARRLGGFSKGMLQRVGLAQALVNQPRLVVLDEPTAGVDPAGSMQIRDIILDLKRRGITILLTSHLLTHVQEICDRVGILANGLLVREGALEELLTVGNQTEIVIENATPDLISHITATAERGGARVVATRRPQTSLERLFLDATEPK
jgi:ABC-2 type transport system ATP-binding protein